MRAAQPNELRDHAFPVMTARISAAELERWFPVPFQEITDPWAAPEPSMGALIRLNAGDYVVLYWGRDSQELTIRIPANVDPSTFLVAFFREVPIPRSRVSWRRPGTRLPRNVAAKEISVRKVRGVAASSRKRNARAPHKK